MKPHRILKSFPGNQTGNGPTEFFEKGTVCDLSVGLAAIVVKEGWAEPVAPETKLVPAEPVIDSDNIVHGTAEDRETKVVEVQETKPAKPKKTKNAA